MLKFEDDAVHCSLEEGNINLLSPSAGGRGAKHGRTLRHPCFFVHFCYSDLQITVQTALQHRVLAGASLKVRGMAEARVVPCEGTNGSLSSANILLSSNSLKHLTDRCGFHLHVRKSTEFKGIRRQIVPVHNVPGNTAYPESYASLPLEQLLEIQQEPGEREKKKKKRQLHAKGVPLDQGTSLRETLYCPEPQDGGISTQ